LAYGRERPVLWRCLSGDVLDEINDDERLGDIVEFVKFNALEEKIRSLIDEKALLKKKNQELEGFLEQKEMELQEVNRKLKGLDEERDAIRTKVDSLLDLLQDIQVPR
jgi:chromosome segregation ATPase